MLSNEKGCVVVLPPPFDLVVVGVVVVFTLVIKFVPVKRRRANSLMAPRGGAVHGGEQQGGAPMHGSRRPFGSTNGRMEGPFGLEERMRCVLPPTVSSSVQP